MATTILGAAQSADGTWQIDYDTVGLTIGHTCTSGTKTHLMLSMTIVATQQTFSKDVSADMNQGRVVDFSNIPNAAIPPHVKGQAYPVTFSGSWS